MFGGAGAVAADLVPFGSAAAWSAGSKRERPQRGLYCVMFLTELFRETGASSRVNFIQARLRMNLFPARLLFWLLFISSSAAAAEDVALHSGPEIISGPKDPANRDAWFEAMKTWRDSSRKRIEYADSE